MLLAVLVGLDRNKLQTYCIVQTLLVDDVAECVLLAGLCTLEN